ncbi:Ankyrin-1 [Wickerhamomyces ciferrii]|uniref:Ankyrin-1 n=1 Tax=Wickerhamomyces ciferrii (strain ATCC 14091 / BCRC 22168 / CBS 111 / JCM 3599 / NBRC 0793 / NRRL Y-1031 F-60-10) TaxID=1206466 RepID=K0KGX2_WICCF|nr:Ankyrin-1 [Wickerhamomyces ciferrii]CCH42226.1 Ankyrin-1 [Wickerhamomyces ciferrii]
MLEPQIRLRQAIKEGNLLVVKRLLKRFPDLLENIDSSNGWTSLHYAAFNGWYLICVHLISLGHDKNEVLKTFKQNTSVHLSLMNGHEQTTHLLLQHFPKILNLKGDEGLNPLHISCIKNHFKCVEMLLAIGADLQMCDDDGNNSLHLAMKFGSYQSIKLLIMAGINQNLQNNNGLKPIDVSMSFQVEKYYNKLQTIPKDELKYFDDFTSNQNTSTTTASTPVITSSGSFSNTSSASIRPTLGNRTHSNSLPPLPSVTTARRSSNASLNTRSPIPRSAISLGFNGSNSNSFTFSPTQTSFNIKPPQPNLSNYQIHSGSNSPVLVSPISGLGVFSSSGGSQLAQEQGQGSQGQGSQQGDRLTNTIVEEGQSGLVNSHSLSSFPSMSSLNSGKQTPEQQSLTNYPEKFNLNLSGGGRTRSSTNQSFNSYPQQQQQPSQKSRSNSYSSMKTKSKEPGKISPPNSSGNLSRTSTTTTDQDQDHVSYLERKESQGSFNSSLQNMNQISQVNTGNTGNSTSSVLSGFFDNEGLRNKLNNKLENVSLEFRNRSNSAVNGVKRGGSGLLDIPIASLRRKE